MNLNILREGRTIFILMTSGIAAFFLVFIAPKDKFLFWIIYRAMYVADTMFHELGHTVFDWAFGMPAIPSIFTLFGSDQAGGVTLTFDRSWFMQGVAFAAMASGCYWANRTYHSFFWDEAIQWKEWWQGPQSNAYKK